MKHTSLEKGLLGWDPWHESIERGRKELGFDPTWPDDEVNGWANNHTPRVRKMAKDEV